MLDNVDSPLSDAWWLKRLLGKINARPIVVRDSRIVDSRRAEFGRRDWMEMLWARLQGNTPLLRVNDRYADATKEFMRLSRTHFAATVVGALQSRVELRGAYTSGPEGDDADGDETIRALMDVNGSFFADALTYAFTMGEAAVIVGPPRPGDTVATATAEDPRQCAWDVDPLDPLKVRAFVKTYRDDTLGLDRAHLMIAGNPTAPRDTPAAYNRVMVAIRRVGVAWTGNYFRSTDWEWDYNASGYLPEPQDEFGLPVVPLSNLYGLGEFETFLDLLDRIHNDIADRLWTQKYQTFLQRALIGNLPMSDPRTGEQIDYDSIFEADPGALWRMPQGSTIWESKQVDLGGLLAGLKSDLQELSSVSSTDMFMFMPDAANGTAEGASQMARAAVDKSKDRVRRMTPPGRRILRLGLAYSNKVDTARGPVRLDWAPIERFTLEQRGAAAVQAKTSGVPQRSILSEVWQFDPTTVARMETERDQDLLYAPTTPPASSSGQPAA